MADESWIKTVIDGVLSLVDRIGTKAFVASLAVSAVSAAVWFVNKVGSLNNWIVIAALAAIVLIVVPFFFVQLNEKREGLKTTKGGTNGGN